MSRQPRRTSRWTRVGGVLAVLMGAAVGMGVYVYKRDVLDAPGEHVSRGAIMKVIAQESPILYRDGQTRIGVFFAREHREYVTYSQIPRAWVQAIVAAEDQYFWQHPGLDVSGIVRAMVRNVQAGRMVAGGSSLTQQTAKNLFYRPDRSLKSKWRELLDALRLESRYSKEDILEFYANQFHVSGNGRGLGIAARYFFDKEVQELSTLECAFIAGMVKAPARYNPFLGDRERRQRARQRAETRTRYVLDRMQEEGYLTSAAHQQITAEPIAFRRGTFQYDSSILVDEVEARLGQAPFPAIFEELGIDNPSTAGISIRTTLDRDAQRAATYGLWHHLSEVGPLMEGLTLTDLGAQPGAAEDEQLRHLEPRTFYTGRVAVADADALTVGVGGTTCTVDRAGLQRMATILAQADKGNRWARASAADVARLVEALSPGTPVRVSVRGEASSAQCDLEYRPELQGGVMLLEQGRIRAMVGGNDNRNFNRSISAQRQLGSTWKPLLYLAGLQLGWTPTDPLDNRSNVFHFEGTWYYPRADHKSEPWTSMSWAGTRSENLATIWLLAHLTDRLDPAEFREVADLVGLTPRQGESRKAFIARIRDKHGVISTRSRLPELAFGASRLEMLDGLDPDTPASRGLWSMSYGRGLTAERARVDSAGGRRHGARTEALNRTYRSVAQVGTRCLDQLSTLRRFVDESRAVATAAELAGWGEPVRGVIDLPELPDPAGFADLSIRVSAEEVAIDCGASAPTGAAIDETHLRWMAQGWGAGAWAPQAVHVGDAVPLSLMKELHASMRRMVLVWEAADPYDMELLQHHPDYRLLVGMAYMNHLAQSMGVRQTLKPVLSMPLGAVDLSLESAATLYQGMLDAQMWSFPGQKLRLDDDETLAAVPSPPHPTQLIAEIRDRDGRVLYRADAMPRPMADPTAGRLVGDILRNVVRWGTGRRANGLVLSGHRIPLAGKTGTTNGYRNAAFAGFVPRAGAQGWRWAQGYTLATYVGYDDNRSMVRGGTRLQGSNGALPVWTSTVEGLAAAGLLGAPGPDIQDEWLEDEGHQRVPVVAGSGLAMGIDIDPQVPLERTVLVQVDPLHAQPMRLFAPVGAPVRALARSVPDAPAGAHETTGYEQMEPTTPDGP